MDVMAKIRELVRKQREIYEKIQSSLLFDELSEEKRKDLLDLNMELSSISFQISALFTSIPLATSAEDILKTIPTVEEIREVMQSCGSTVAGKAKSFLDQISTRLGGLMANEKETTAAQNEFNHTFEAIKGLLNVGQKDLAVSTVMKINRDKGVNILDVAVIQMIDTIKTLLDNDREDTARKIFKGIYPET